ncbi:hypothetical protein [Acidihalobacter ferrooxydans]|uniref:YubB ferredoxin-like domain-containing protein n=1 Tax=Acidihalobacter ferrooxydans TaxID=1765967 RepID=A0A1P8UFJ0_9GAMM|nr:hypothetical protein [Acidihalobacter ferrooxydans]APZ42616.1 hypothetical protein BW247_05485 [Acidihalobacter ferrooxydans]
MPNHVINRVVVVDGDPETLRPFISTTEEEGTFFDFEKLVPMPKELKIEESSIGKNGYDIFHGNENAPVLRYPWMQEKICEYRKQYPDEAGRSDQEIAQILYRGTEEERIGNIYADNLKKHGAKTWYDWSCAHWGTKWNSYHFSEVDGLKEFTFDTAWSPPAPIYSKIAEMLPEHRIIVGCFDEGSCFACLFVIEDGHVEDMDIDTGDPAFYAACYGMNYSRQPYGMA